MLKLVSEGVRVVRFRPNGATLRARNTLIYNALRFFNNDSIANSLTYLKEILFYER